MLSRELVERLGFLQQFQDDLGLEGGTVRSFHMVISPNSGVVSVHIPGSIIGIPLPEIVHKTSM